ncbi:MAG TPA: hypothetical protein PLA39_09115 [Methanoculleus sp.]|nr:hypothetical protein [Methanoculleus sp.]
MRSSRSSGKPPPVTRSALSSSSRSLTLSGRSSTDVVTTLSGFARKVFLDYATSDTPISGTEFRFILACLLRPRR